MPIASNSVEAPETAATAPSVRSISARRVAVGTVYNLMGLGVPLILALAVTPYLIRTLGLDRYAVLSIMLVIIGYASLFDLGIGRSLTKMVAEKLGAGQEQEVAGWTATGLVLLAALGMLGAVVIAFAAGPLFGRLVKVPANLQAEVIQATARDGNRYSIRCSFGGAARYRRSVSGLSLHEHNSCLHGGLPRALPPLHCTLES